jgi:membrane protease YdiL (CAAX protease family)
LKRHPAFLFSALAFVLTWIVWLPRALEIDWAVELGAVWTYGPALAAVCAAMVVGGRAELARLGRRIIEWQIGLGWYLIILAFPLVMALVETSLMAATTSSSWSNSLPSVFGEPLLSSALFLIVLVLTDGLGEELGWRGFALPHMLAKNTALVASLVIGVFWAAWHLPLFWTDGAPLEGSSIWVLFARLPAAAVIYTWLFQHTKGSVLAAALFHGALNLFARAPADVDGLTPALVSTGLWWLVAVAVTLVAGASGLDRWPGVRRRHSVRSP